MEPDKTPEPESSQPNDTVPHSTEVQLNVPEQVNAAAAPVDKKRRFHKPSGKLIIITGASLVLIAGLVSYLALSHHQKPVAVTTAKPQTTALKLQTIKPEQVAEQTVQKIIDSDNIKFLQVPAKLTNIDLFTNYGELFGYSCNNGGNTCKTPSVAPSDVQYAVLGYRTVDSKTQNVIAVTNTLGGEMGWTYYAIEDSPNHYQFLLAMSVDPAKNPEFVATFKKYVASNVTVNTTDILNMVQFPHTVTLGGRSFKSSFDDPNNGYFIGNLSKIRGSYFGGTIAASAMTSLGTQNNRQFYEVTADDRPNFQLKEVYGSYAGITATSYLPIDPLTDDKNPTAVQWTDSRLDGATNHHSYATRTAGCGSANGYAIAKNIDDSQLLTAGTTPDGDTVYQLPVTSPLFQEIYTQDYAGGSDLAVASLKQLSAANFQSQHGLLLARNQAGEYAIYLRNDLFQGGGCGKPVLYLYPTHTMDVSVKVGADITKSAPQYDASTGWQHVSAHPGGQLYYQGTAYNSLFWEGTGDGTYPAITSGTVVQQAQLVATIRRQLQQQGLNSQETQDFMAFWQPKLPTTPYVRLTWFNTQQMNQLAPLQISPRPNSLIRTFLDFQGLYAPLKLQPQTFQTTPRHGFTAVEWGGLLRQ